jgi:hypothetical protein
VSNKLGRNELCSCGSGKKYKKCCIANNSASDLSEILDFAWHKLRQIELEAVHEHLMPYLKNSLPDELMLSALFEFCPGGLPEAMDEGLIFDQLFIPWVLFTWIPNKDFEIGQYDPQKTIAGNYIAAHGKSLNSAVLRFIEAMNQTYYSFYSIQEVVPEKRLVVRDILLGTTHTIKEKKATRTAKRGNIILGRILTLDNQAIFAGTAPYTIPVSYQNQLLDYKSYLIEENDNQDLNPDILREYSINELIYYFFEIIDAYNNKPLPKLVNTDGDPIIFSKSYFKVKLTPAEVLQKLLALTLPQDADDFLSEAKRNSAGKITEIEFPWLKKGNKKHKAWDNTVMGNILVKEKKLILETNSQKRAMQGHKLLKHYLGDDVTFEKTLLEAPEQKLKSPANISNKNDKDEDKEEENELLAQPEVQNKIINQMVIQHWQDWFDIRIPALANKTPREAARTKEGRERLEALFLIYEQSADKNSKTDIFKPDINYLKQELGLL